jgi:hypothetical protein
LFPASNQFSSDDLCLSATNASPIEAKEPGNISKRTLAHDASRVSQAPSTAYLPLDYPEHWQVVADMDRFAISSGHSRADLTEMPLRAVNAKGLFDKHLKSTNIRCEALVGDRSDANRNTRS